MRFLLPALLILPLTLSGCAQAVLLGYLLGGPPSIEPDFDAVTGESLSNEGVTVAVVCYAPNDIKWDFEKIDHEINKMVSQRLFQNHIKPIDPQYIRAWMDENPDWDRPEEIGEAFNVNYVIDIELQSFSLYEENSTTLYRGRTEAYVNVVKMEKDDAGQCTGEGERIYSKEVNSVFPTQAPRSTHDDSFQGFKQEYLSRLSETIGWLFYDRFHGDMIPWAT